MLAFGHLAPRAMTAMPSSPALRSFWRVQGLKEVAASYRFIPACATQGIGQGCETGTLLAQAVPADYASDVLLTNWTKPSYNPIMENTQRDPSTPWQTPTGEWRLRTYDSRIYGAANASEILHGRWYEIGKSESLRTCECPSFYPLPPPTAGRESETAYAAAMATGGSALPTHVHKTSCGGDFWQLGTYDAGPRHTTGTFSPTAGWEDTFAQRRIDHGRFYASKDSIYPTLGSSKLRRINWGWAQVPPQGAQTLPREITFNAAARQLEQAPIAELAGLRLPAAFGPSSSPIAVPSGRPFVLLSEAPISCTRSSSSNSNDLWRAASAKMVLSSESSLAPSPPLSVAAPPWERSERSLEMRRPWSLQQKPPLT